MKNVGIVAVRDYLLNVANEVELAEFKQLIAERERVLRARAASADDQSGQIVLAKDQ